MSEDFERRLIAVEREVTRLRQIVEVDHQPSLLEHGDTLRQHSETLDSHGAQLTMLSQVRLDVSRMADNLTASMLSQERVLRKVETLIDSLPAHLNRIDERLRHLER